MSDYDNIVDDELRAHALMHREVFRTIRLGVTSVAMFLVFATHRSCDVHTATLEAKTDASESYHTGYAKGLEKCMEAE